MRKGILLIVIVLLSVLEIKAQVTIGSGVSPNNGALLDLKAHLPSLDNETASTGLMLPRVKLFYLDRLRMGTNDIPDGDTNEYAKYRGLMVYNIASRETNSRIDFCPGIYTWNGKEWIALQPYPPIVERTELIGSTVYRGNPEIIVSDTDPFWKESGLNPKDYPLGVLNEKMVDADGYNYVAKRFYVAYQLVDKVLQTEHNRSCNEQVELWVPNEVTVTKTIKEFRDGVWITSNVYSTQKASSGAFTLGLPYLHPARNNLKTRIMVPPLGYTSDEITYNENELPKASSENMSECQEDFARKFGLLYNYQQALELCPSGWKLPDNQDWKALQVFHEARKGGVKQSLRANNNYFKAADYNEFKWGSESLPFSGFNAYPSGSYRKHLNRVDNFGVQTQWWSTTVNGAYQGSCSYGYMSRSLQLDLSSPFDQKSVRCMKE